MAVSIGGSEIFRNAHLTVHCDHRERIVLVRRSSLPFQRVEEIEATIAGIAKAFPPERRAGFAIISDFRDGPIRVHPALEPAFARYRQETERGFTRAAIIVSTPVGRVRGDRLRDTADLPVAMVESLEEALNFVKASE